ncbi:MAG: DUF58 domain-containing protein [Bacteroidetes bacterium]|nr:DUF58 domain-containing protein [Bacteroidota bacterium]MDA1335636.1 DUF58 domain-containing protein [Bacteroidota bacterium]
METAELIQRVRRVELKTRGLSDRIFSGEYHSAFKGRGMAFSENRSYQHGDEIRTIDWNVTARMGQPFVKVFEEERELTVFLLIDVSGSNTTGTRQRTKKELITELSAVIAFSAMGNNDKVGAILFSDTIERFIPPKKGRSHILRIIREIIEVEPASKGTSIDFALEHFLSAIKKRSIAFLISDFRSPDFEQILRQAGKKHDLIALRVSDPLDRKLPSIGWIPVQDPESNQTKWVYTGRTKTRQNHAMHEKNRESDLKALFARCGIDQAVLLTNRPYVQPLMQLFDRRG